MSFYPELEKLSLEQLITCFQLPCPEGQEYASSYYPEVALLIRQQGKSGINLLLQGMEQADSEQLRASIFALTESRLDHPTLRERLLSYLHDKRPLIVAEAIDGLRRQGEKEAQATILGLIRHPSTYVRNSVARYIGAILTGKEALSELRMLLKDVDAGVRESAIDEISHLDQIDAIEYLRPLLSDTEPYVRETAQAAIEVLKDD